MKSDEAPVPYHGTAKHIRWRCVPFLPFLIRGSGYGSSPKYVLVKKPLSEGPREEDTGKQVKSLYVTVTLSTPFVRMLVVPYSEFSAKGYLPSFDTSYKRW